MNKKINIITEINFFNLDLKTFTEQDVLDYCQINNINPDNIIKLWLHDNKATDISGIKLFKNLIRADLAYNELTNISVLKDLKNLDYLDISNNKITDISALKDLKNLEYLNIENLELKSNQIKYTKSLKKLYEFRCENGFKNT